MEGWWRVNFRREALRNPAGLLGSAPIASGDTQSGQADQWIKTRLTVHWRAAWAFGTVEEKQTAASLKRLAAGVLRRKPRVRRPSSG
jgi:hypothetical protein